MPVIGYAFQDAFLYQYYITDSVASNPLPAIFVQIDLAAAIEAHAFGF